MDKANSKIINLAFMIAGLLVWLVTQILIQTFAAAVPVVARFANNDFTRHGLPVLLGVALFAFLQFNRRTLTWADEVIVELKKVIWPPRKDLSAMTMVVVVMVLISSAIIWVFDALSSVAISTLMK